jgi:hypothetical protein
MIPDTTLQLARDLIALQSRALAESLMLTAASDQASGAEAVGKAALASECEQVGKVLSNYMPRIMKHIGEVDALISDDFLAAETQAGEDRSATVARLQLELEVLVNRSYGGPLSDADQARMGVLTANLRLGG